MGLPSEDRGLGAANGNGTFYDDHNAESKGSPTLANGRSNSNGRQRRMDTSAPQQDRSERPLDPNSEADPRQRSRSNNRRPSGQQRICGKCQMHLTGQFVRALGDTYHLECFTCHVRIPNSP